MLFWLGFWDFFDEVNWICIHIYKITFNLIYVIPKRIEFLPFHQQFTCINTVYILILNRYTIKNIFNRTQNFNSEPLGRFEHLGYHENEWTVGGGVLWNHRSVYDYNFRPMFYTVSSIIYQRTCIHRLIYYNRVLIKCWWGGVTGVMFIKLSTKSHPR